MEATDADSYQLYITTDDKSNFRYDIATIKPYKGHRKAEKPHWYTHIRNFLVDHRGAIEVHGMEADDAMAIEQWKDYTEARNLTCGWMHDAPIDYMKPACKTVICSRDKDLNMVPGWHYTWGCGQQKERKVWWQDEMGGLKLFYKQCLTGDSVDNIPGLYNVGKSSTLLKHVDSMDSEYEMYRFVLEEYHKRFGSYAEQFLIENARLLFMLREEGVMWEIPKKI